MDASERRAWIQLALTPYIGAESFYTLLQHFGSAAAALAAPHTLIARLAHHGRQAAAAWQNPTQAQAAADAALQWENQADCRLLLAADNDFPAMLGQGQTPPPLLFARGDSALLNRPCISIVGSRHATPQAMRIARDFAAALSSCGITVVSGMAGGIDTAAHEGALPHSGSTVAVWGTGIDRVYPQSNKNLAHQIAENGLIVSEFPLGTRPIAGNFPRRNRLIAAQSCATLVVEAALESGSLITAAIAAEIGREVMAVPGSIDNPHSKGCHKLIKDGAKLVECLDDILHECPELRQFEPIYPNAAPNLPTKLSTSSVAEETPPAPIIKYPATQTEKLPEKSGKTLNFKYSDQNSLLAKMGYDPIHPDTLAELSGLNAAEVYAQLLEYELDGLIAPLTGGRYQRVR